MQKFSPAQQQAAHKFESTKIKQMSLKSDSNSSRSPSLAGKTSLSLSLSRSVTSSLSAGSSILHLTKKFPKDWIPSTPLQCDGTWFHQDMFKSNRKIALHGLGFFGQTGAVADAFYDICVEIVGFSTAVQTFSSEVIMKRIFAMKGQVFYFIFDEPIIIRPISDDDWGNCYYVRFSLKGPSTSATKRDIYTQSKIKKGSTTFYFLWRSNQLAEILYKKL